MKEIKIAQAPVFTSPNPMTFICSKKADGKTNMATIAFWTYASTNPGKVVFSLIRAPIRWNFLQRIKKSSSPFPASLLRARSSPAVLLREGIPIRLKNSALKCRNLTARILKFQKIPALHCSRDMRNGRCGRPCSAYLQRKECLCGRKRRSGVRLERLCRACRRAEKINYGISHQR